MRAHATRLLLLITLALFIGSSPRAFADARADAKVHYQAGVKAYGAQDYRTAIKEFSAAQQLAPADLNNYNLALCYDKLGEAESAIQYYKEYLAKVPNADKRVEIEASISRLEAALQSAAAKRAEEQKKADEAAKAEEARKAEEAAKAEEARKAEEAKKAEELAKQQGQGQGQGQGGAVGAGDIGVGSTGTPSTGMNVSTGDAQLDRVASIDINQIRDQRMGAGGSGIPDTRGGPATVGATGAVGNVNAGAQGPQGNMGPQGPQGAQAQNQGQAPANGQMPADGQPQKKETPVYKKWWFWAVVAVSAYVVYSIAADGSSSQTNRARDVLPPQSNTAVGGGGVPLFRF